MVRYSGRSPWPTRRRGEIVVGQLHRDRKSIGKNRFENTIYLLLLSVLFVVVILSRSSNTIKRVDKNIKICDKSRPFKSNVSAYL